MKRFVLSRLAAFAVCVGVSAQKAVSRGSKPSKVFVAYFSATGNTAEAARKIAAATGGRLHEIVPEKRYTAADLDWRDKKSRCTVEMHNLKFRPALKEKKSDLSSYSVVYLGYPIWWNIAPTIINSFIESNDLKGKTVIPFATSGGSGIANSVAQLKKLYPSLKWGNGKLLNYASDNDIRKWVGK